jgi:branched-chain amino acid transport system substrate-binding protein
LIDPATNLFRFNPDAAQLMAGLGDYAYRRLGWRRVALVADRNPFGYAQAAGFVAEFCALGGTVATRIFPRPDGSDLQSEVRRLPARGLDGVLVTTAFVSVPFLRAYMPGGRLSNRVLLGGAQSLGSMVQAFGPRATGLVAAAGLAPTATPQSRRYERGLRRAFPSLSLVEPRFDVYYYNAMAAVLGALATVHGDLSDQQRGFRAALAQTVLDAPNGVIRLDRNRQAVLPNYLVQLQRRISGGLIPRTIRTIPRVDESFGGLFLLNGPPASAVSPRCTAGDPPPWARSS